MRIYEKKNFPRTARDFAKMMEKGTLSFDNAVQRSFVWKNTTKDNRMSMLIDTMIRGFCVPPMYCNCIFEDATNKVYDFVDGKQRVMTVIKFLNDEFPLVGIPTFTLDNGEELDINGRYFSELPEDFQDNIKMFNFTVNYYENMEQDDIEELFCRLNNGKPLSAIELTRANAKSKNQIRTIASHPIFDIALNEKGMAKYDNEDIAIKAWIMLFGNTKSFETKVVRPIMQDTDISDYEVNTINECFDYLLDVYNKIKEKDTKESIRVCKKIVKKTHFLSLLSIIDKALSDDINLDLTSDWIMEFFDYSKGASINEEYNENSKAGSAKADAIKKREAALMESFESYLSLNQ